MSYLDLGYDEFLNPIQPSTQQSAGMSTMDPQEFDNFTDQISGSKIQGGVMQTTDGKTTFNLEQGFFSVVDGQELVRLGIQDDGSVGLIIRNNEGKELLRFTGNVNKLQSPNEHFIADFNEEYLLSKDEAGIPRALFGKGDF